MGCGRVEETTTAKKYCQQIDGMHKNLFQKRLALVNSKRPILLLGNARMQQVQQLRFCGFASSTLFVGSITQRSLFQKIKQLHAKKILQEP